jgi:energy-converting hydrogenase A subunit R
VFISDCEGPISINDNAFELAGHFIEDGEKFFTVVSKYDDILVENKREGYYAGGTLKLIVPFLKAYGATNENIIEFSAKNVHLVPGAKEMLSFVNSIMPSFIVSTSYKQYIQVLCDLTSFPFENTYFTSLDMVDEYSVSGEEKQKLMEFRKIIIENPDFEILDKIFWDEILKLSLYEIMKNVNPVGGEGKKEAVLDIVNKYGFKESDIMYVGDSITDVEPLKFVKESGGLAISFNGNEYAVMSAEIAVMADNTVITSIIADLFNKFGKIEVINFIESYMDNPEDALNKYTVNKELKEMIKQVNLPKIAVITGENYERVVNESKTFRNIVRGEAIGALG